MRCGAGVFAATRSAAWPRFRRGSPLRTVAGRPGSYSDTSWRSKARLRAGNARRGAATNPTTDA